MMIDGWGEWTGPNPDDWDGPGEVRLREPVPGARWPYGPPPFHQEGCTLHTGGLFCDCAASDASDTEWGVGS